MLHKCVSVSILLRAGHLDRNGHFVAATVPINDGANVIALRSIINDRALIPPGAGTCSRY